MKSEEWVVRGDQRGRVTRLFGFEFVCRIDGHEVRKPDVICHRDLTRFTQEVIEVLLRF